MPNTDFISNLLDIKDLIAENVELFTSEVYIYFKSRHRDCVCPVCGAITNKIHDWSPHLPKVLPIDKFKGNASGQKFQAIITAPGKRKVIDILPSRTQYKLKEYLRSFSEPQRSKAKTAKIYIIRTDK